MIKEIFYWLKDLLVVVASLVAIVTFIKWKRQIFLTRKISLFEDFYRKFLQLHGEVKSLYTPDILVLIEFKDINLNNDDLKKRIKEHRYERLAKKVTLFFEIMAEQEILNKYFDLRKFFEDFKTTWTKLHISTMGPY